MDDGIGIVDEGGTGPLRLWGHHLSKHPKTIDWKNSNGGCWQENQLWKGAHTKASVVPEVSVGAVGAAICGRVPPSDNVYKRIARR